MSSSFGEFFRVTTFGESHGPAVGVVLDGCPSRIPLGEEDIQPQLDRRRPGQSTLTTPRDEPDRVTILAGVADGHTLGSPIAMVVANKDARPEDYSKMTNIPRPSHADYTYRQKYGTAATSGGGRASARDTVGRVAAGTVAEKILAARYSVEIVAWVDAVGEITTPYIDSETVNREKVDRTRVRCPDAAASARMEVAIAAAKEAGDSVGGIVACVCRHVPAGWGEPVFDKLEAKLAQAMLSLPATKGFEIGSGFAGSRMSGSEHNDPFVRKGDRLGTRSNHSGGVQGGISNGEPLWFRVAFKPPATIGRPQRTADYAGNEVVLEAKGRHDPCVLPRAVPIVESMAALVLVDLALRQRGRTFMDNASNG